MKYYAVTEYLGPDSLNQHDVLIFKGWNVKKKKKKEEEEDRNNNNNNNMMMMMMITVSAQNSGIFGDTALKASTLAALQWNQ